MSTGFVAAVLIVEAVLAAASVIVMAVMSANIDSPDKPPKPDAPNLTLQSEGKVVPVIFGYVYLGGNLIYWDSENQGSTYASHLFYVICMGEVWDWDSGRTFIFRNEKMYRNRNLAVPDFWEPGILSSGTADQYLIDAGINHRYNLPGMVWNWFEINKGAHPEIGDTNPDWTICPWDEGEDGSRIPQYVYFLRRKLDTPLTYNVVTVGAVDVGDNPAAVIYNILTNKQWGLGIDVSEINKDNFDIASEYYNLKGYGINCIINDVMSGNDLITQIQDWVECYLMKDNEDKYIIKYLLDSDADHPDATIVDTDRIEFTLRRKSWEDTYNSFTIKYTDIWDHGNPEMPSGRAVIRMLIAKNEANIAMTGSTRNKVIDLTGFIRRRGGLPSHISERLQTIMKKESYPFATAHLITDLKFSYLQAGNVILISSDEHNILAPFRIIAVDVKEIDNNRIGFDLLQMREIISDSNYDDFDSSGGSRSSVETPDCLENVTFPAFSNVSNKLKRTIQKDKNSVVSWGANQEMFGLLIYGTDYILSNHKRIVLDPIIWQPEIEANALGLMNVNVYEPGCPAES